MTVLEKRFGIGVIAGALSSMTGPLR